MAKAPHTLTQQPHRNWAVWRIKAWGEELQAVVHVCTDIASRDDMAMETTKYIEHDKLHSLKLHWSTKI